MSENYNANEMIALAKETRKLALEEAAQVAEAEAALMAQTADYHKPPRAEVDCYLSDLHEQWAIACQNIAKAIRALKDQLHE